MRDYNFPRPELLTHPNIPMPLHGMNPRTILGQAWWDDKRQEAYAKYNYHCWACGIHKTEAKYHQWLEAHEAYDIDYKRGRVKLIEIVALCHSCHNFIHSGKLWMMYQKAEISHDRIVEILLHGLTILRENNLTPFSETQRLWSMLTDEMGMIDRDEVPRDIAPWHKWHLVLEGRKYYGHFKSYDEWREYYA